MLIFTVKFSYKVFGVTGIKLISGKTLYEIN